MKFVFLLYLQLTIYQRIKHLTTFTEVGPCSVFYSALFYDFKFSFFILLGLPVEVSLLSSSSAQARKISIHVPLLFTGVLLETRIARRKQNAVFLSFSDKSACVERISRGNVWQTLSWPIHSSRNQHSRRWW